MKLIETHEFNLNLILHFNHPFLLIGSLFSARMRGYHNRTKNLNKVIALVREMHSLLGHKMKKLITLTLLPSLNHVPLLHDFFIGPLRAQATKSTTSDDDGPGQFFHQSEYHHGQNFIMDHIHSFLFRDSFNLLMASHNSHALQIGSVVDGHDQ